MVPHQIFYQIRAHHLRPADEQAAQRARAGPRPPPPPLIPPRIAAPHGRQVVPDQAPGDYSWRTSGAVDGCNQGRQVPVRFDFVYYGFTVLQSN